ncbi:MAG: restriction endonuclease subunit S [Ruminococcus sp.]|nr:restriction endonuclease subunit S [Ruminococcus sp.]
MIPKIDICSRYYNYLLKDIGILDSIFLYETGTANQGNLGIENIRRTILHNPPLEEQLEIADYLDKKCSAIDSAIEKKQAIIKKLKEYKKSLIHECVTGKREV